MLAAAALPNSSEMAGRIRSFDWAGTDIGPAEKWSLGFCSALNLCLGSRLCSAIYWGPRQLVIYNDAYSALLGSKHPWALGRPAAQVWSEVFDVIGSLMVHTRETGESTGADDAAIFLNRSGYVEEFYCSFSYSPLVNEFGNIEGVFTMFPETTTRVIGERRLQTVQQLGSRTRGSRRPREVLEISAEVFARNNYDIPFAGLYLWDEGCRSAKLCASSGIDAGAALCPLEIDADDPGELSSLVCGREMRALTIRQHLGADITIPSGAWPIAAQELLFVPFEPYGEGAPKAFMLCAVNPYKHLDSRHLSFFRMIADQVSGALAEAFSRVQEGARLHALRERARTAQQDERVRIARDLHDTVLQSIQGMRHLLEAAIERSKSGDATAINLFERALDASVFAIDEGRAVLSLLRSTAPTAEELATSIATLGKELVAGTDISFELRVSGQQRDIDFNIRGDIDGICREALTNVVRHSRGSTIIVELKFENDFALVIRDDGRGIAADVADHGRIGHYGIPGMRERAEKIGGALFISAAPGRGTEVKLTIGGTVAYLRNGRSA